MKRANLVVIGSAAAVVALAGGVTIAIAATSGNDPARRSSPPPPAGVEWVEARPTTTPRPVAPPLPAAAPLGQTARPTPSATTPAPRPTTPRPPEPTKVALPAPPAPGGPPAPRHPAGYAPVSNTCLDGGAATVYVSRDGRFRGSARFCAQLLRKGADYFLNPYVTMDVFFLDNGTWRPDTSRTHVDIEVFLTCSVLRRTEQRPRNGLSATTLRNGNSVTTACGDTAPPHVTKTTDLDPYAVTFSGYKRGGMDDVHPSAGPEKWVYFPGANKPTPTLVVRVP